MDVCAITANLGNFEIPVPFVEQSVPYDFFMFTDKNFPPRSRSMTSRLQARIVKMFTWQFAPGYEYYLWVDSSCTLPHKDSVQWFLERLGEADMAIFKHPHRKTIGEEADYIKYRLSINCSYITPRYENEILDEQLEEISNPDLPLYASTAFIYRDSYEVRQMFKEWWYGTSRYHTVDQIWLPYALEKSGISVNVIHENYLKCKYLKPVRK